MNYYKGAAWFIISLIISSLNDVVAKYVSFNLPVWETVFFRFFFGTITLVPFILFYGKESIASSKPLVHLSRGIILTLAIYLWINGLNVTDVAVATIITFTMPIFVLILAATLLKEKVSIKLWVLSIIGLIGVVITLNPKGIEFNINSTYLIFAAGFFASLDIINKKYIADNIFSDPKKLKKINSILHPRVRKRIEFLSQEYFKESDIVFVEAALIFESKIENMYDYVVLITADKELRMTRSTTTKKISKEDFIKREKNQMNEESKKKKADFIFTNDGTVSELKLKAILLINLLKPTQK